MLIYVVGDPENKVVEEINNDLVVLHDWFNNNNLKVNINKTKFMIFRNKYIKINPNQNR